MRVDNDVTTDCPLVGALHLIAARCPRCHLANPRVPFPPPRGQKNAALRTCSDTPAAGVPHAVPVVPTDSSVKVRTRGHPTRLLTTLSSDRAGGRPVAIGDHVPSADPLRWTPLRRAEPAPQIIPPRWRRRSNPAEAMIRVPGDDARSRAGRFPARRCWLIRRVTAADIGRSARGSARTGNRAAYSRGGIAKATLCGVLFRGDLGACVLAHH